MSILRHAYSRADHNARYWLVWRVGLVLKTSTDGTPWLVQGQRFVLRFSRWSVRFALGRHLLAVRWVSPSDSFGHPVRDQV